MPRAWTNTSAAFYTYEVERGRTLVDIDRGFFKYCLPGHSKKEMEDRLTLEYERLNKYLDRRNGVKAAYLKNKEKQNSRHDTTVRNILRYQALEKCEGAAKMIGESLSENSISNCVIFGISHSVMTAMKIFLHQFNPCIIHPGTSLEHVERNHRLFIRKKRKVLILNIQSNHGLDLSECQDAFFIEHSLDPEENIKALRQLKREYVGIHVGSFCLKDPLDRKLNELITFSMQRIVNGGDYRLPEEFV